MSNTKQDKAILHHETAYNLIGDYQKTSPSSAVEVIRTLILTGMHSEADSLITCSLESVCEPSIKAEIYLEQACLAFYRLEFSQGISFASEGLLLEPTVVTKLSLLQGRASCYYELGEFELFLKDAEEIETFANIDPKGPILFLSRLNKVKVMARTAGIEAGCQMLDKEWESFIRGEVNINRNHLQALARVEIDMARLREMNYLGWANLVAIMAKDSGDALYEALALIDVLVASGCGDPVSLHSHLKDEAQEFQQIQRTLDSLFSNDDKGITVNAIKKEFSSTPEKIPTELSSLKSKYYSLSPAVFLIPSRQLLLSRKPFKFIHVKQNSKNFDILKSLSAGEMTEKDFFQRLYHQKYSPSLHDNLVRTQLNRIQKNLGVSITAEGGMLRWTDGYVV